MIIDQLLSEEVVQVAFDLAQPSIENLFSSRNTSRLNRYKKRNVVCVCVFRLRSYESANFDNDIIAQMTYGNQASHEWPHPFDDVAKGKGRVSWRTRRSSRDVLENSPGLFHLGEFKFPGSNVFCGAFGVSASGLEPEDDEMAADLVAAPLTCFYHRFTRALSEQSDVREITEEAVADIITNQIKPID